MDIQSYQSRKVSEEGSTSLTRMYWISGLAPIITSIVTPLIVFLQMKSTGKTLLARYNQQVNEVVRQFISGTIGLYSYFGGGELTHKLLSFIRPANTPLNSQRKEDYLPMMVGGIAISFIGYAFIRPVLCTQIICKFMKEQGIKATINKQQLISILERVKSSNTQNIPRQELESLINNSNNNMQKISIKSQQSEFILIKHLQNWIDKHFFDSKENPLIGKATTLSTLALTSWLALNTALVYVANRIIYKPKQKTSTYWNTPQQPLFIPNKTASQKPIPPSQYSTQLYPSSNLFIGR